jgi:hypothetical protein
LAAAERRGKCGRSVASASLPRERVSTTVQHLEVTP